MLIVPLNGVFTSRFGETIHGPSTGSSLQKNHTNQRGTTEYVRTDFNVFWTYVRGFNIFVDGLLSTSYLIIGTQHRRMKSIYMDTPYDPHLVETHNTTIVGRHLLHDLTPSHHHTLSEA